MALSRHRDGRRGKSSRAKRRAANNANRRLRHVATQGRNAHATLLAILAQKGGEIVVTKGTIDQVTENYARLGWVVERKGEEGNEFTVKLVEGPADSTGAGDHSTEDGGSTEGAGEPGEGEGPEADLVRLAPAADRDVSGDLQQGQ